MRVSALVMVSVRCNSESMALTEHSVHYMRVHLASLRLTELSIEVLELALVSGLSAY